MSQKYTGGFITKSPVAPTSSAASGIWTLDQQQQAQKAGTWPSPPMFIEDLFSTYLWTTSASNQTLTTGIDMTQGALTWIKSRSNVFSHVLQTGIGGGVLPNNALSSNTTGAYFGGNYRIADSTTGFTMGTDYYTGTPETAVVWTFRKQPKFFDVVTYTGTGSPVTVNHNLGSTPGCIIIKATSNAQNWQVWHRSAVDIYGNGYLILNSTAAVAGGPLIDSVSSTNFVVSSGASDVGYTYVCYVFAHNAGGFPASGGGSTNGISCGSFSGNTTVTLGYEPQWIMLKRTDAVGNWDMHDVMRGWPASGDAARLRANLADAESQTSQIYPNATGFSTLIGTGTYIYIAIRRGPMKTPTVGTSVYQANTYTGNATANTTVAGNFGFPVDLLSLSNRSADATNWANYGHYMIDRLQGQNVSLGTSTTTANITGWGTYNAFDVPNSIGWGLYGTNSGTNYMNNSGGTFVARGFRRAPSFFDEVCYTGTGSATTQTHNLGVVPELLIIKTRSNAVGWAVSVGAVGYTNGGRLELTDPFYSEPNRITGTPTTTTFPIGTDAYVNVSARTYVAYLFATLAGVSKVGSYTGTAALLTVDCGFTSGARFVLIKRTDSTGAWYVWDSARGITAGDDPYLLLNSTAAEVTNTNYVDTDTTGFKVTAAAPAALNANGGTYIFLAIA